MEREISDRERRFAIMGFILIIAFIVGYYIIHPMSYFN